MSKFWLSGAVVAMVCAGGLPPLAAQAEDQPPIGCGDAKIDGSTAEQAHRKIAAAGYADITDLKKGCDNFWHGKAMKDGAPTGVVLSPDGRVMPEGR